MHGMSTPERVVIGKVTTTFGTKGEIKVRPFTESLEVFKRSVDLFLGDSPFRVLNIRSYRSDVLVTLDGVHSREEAIGFTGMLVSTSKKHFPEKAEDEYYWFELKGLKVVTVEGRDLGTVRNIIPTGAHDVLEIQGPAGEVLLPWIDEVLAQVDMIAGVIVVDPLEGLVPDA